MALALPVALYQSMFLFSGVKKIASFDAKVATLADKIQQRTSVRTPLSVARAGMIGAIVLEIVGSLYLIYVAMHAPSSPKRKDPLWRFVTTCVITAMVAFVVVATLLYHFPSGKRVIPALSNLTTASGFVFMWMALM